MTRPARVVVITGPTASGKTALSIDVAHEVDGEIISMDSRQVYRGMDIGTAKATPEQRAAVPHHGLDLVDPDQRFSAGRFAAYARERIGEIEARGRLPILVGGTGFFLRALTHPIFREPPLDPVRRARLTRYLDDQPTERLRRWVLALDPPLGTKLQHWGGRQRLVRALEMPLLTGRPLSWWQERAPADESPLDPLVFVLNPERAELYRTIDHRVGEMLDAGLIDEVRQLMERGFDDRSPGMNATGYIELIPYLRGETSLDAAADEIRRHTRAYARRQLTWFRNQLPAGAVWLDAAAPREQLVEEVVSSIARAPDAGEYPSS